MSNCPSYVGRIDGVGACRANEMRPCVVELGEDCPFQYCPECGTQLEHFSGLEQIPEYFYCPKCMDKAYNLEGEVLFALE